MENIKIRNLISTFTIIVMIATVFAIPVFNDNYKVYAASKVNVTFKANGGKIGSKTKTTATIVKGKKIGKKLPAASKMNKSGYTFMGWYTAKKGGSKLKKTTKVKKNKTYYAQWKKDYGSELLGTWSGVGSYLDYQNRIYSTYHTYTFKKNGTFEAINSKSITQKYTGKYSVSKKIVFFTELKLYRKTPDGYIDVSDYLDNRSVTAEYLLGKDSNGDFLIIHRMGDGDYPYFELGAFKFRKNK